MRTRLEEQEVSEVGRDIRMRRDKSFLFVRTNTGQSAAEIYMTTTNGENELGSCNPALKLPRGI